MKILHILDHSLPLHSGYTFRSQNIFKCQQKIGLHPIVVTSPKHEESWGKKSQKEEMIDGIKYYRTGKLEGSNLPVLAELKLIKKLQDRIYEIALKEKPHIIHAHSPVLNAIAARKVGYKLNIPVIYEVRAFWEDAAVDHGTYKENSLKYRIVRHLETSECRKVNMVLTICEGLKADLLHRGILSKKVEVVPNAIEPDNFFSVERDPAQVKKWGLQAAKIVGFIGSFYHYEGLDLLLKAVRKLLVKIPELKILLVGGGMMAEDLKKLSLKLGLNKKVIFTGRVPHSQVPVMYSLIDILVLPRKSMRLTELVTPLKPLEAMAMKKAILASDVGGHKELIFHRKTGYLFKADNVEDLASKLYQLISNDNLRNTIAQRGYEWVVNERTWDQNALIYKKVYEKCSTC